MSSSRPSAAAPAPAVTREAIHEALRAWPARHDLVLPNDGPSDFRPHSETGVRP